MFARRETSRESVRHVAAPTSRNSLGYAARGASFPALLGPDVSMRG